MSRRLPRSPVSSAVYEPCEGHPICPKQEKLLRSRRFLPGTIEFCLHSSHRSQCCPGRKEYTAGELFAPQDRGNGRKSRHHFHRPFQSNSYLAHPRIVPRRMRSNSSHRLFLHLEYCPASLCCCS